MKIIKLLKPYIVSTLLFLFIGIIFKTIETVFCFSTQNTISFSTIIKSYFNLITAFSLYAFIILPLYLLIGLLSKRVAQIVISLFFALLIALEIGLYVYHLHAGVLMGKELLIRPFSEILTTIRNSSDLVTNSILIIIIATYFAFAPLLLKRVKFLNNARFLIAGIITIGLLSICTFFYQRVENRSINNYLESKSFYFFTAIIGKSNENSGFEINKNLLKEYISLYNQSNTDFNYPMERLATEFPDVFSPFFKKSCKQPNIVIIIVESLGNYLLGDQGNGVSFTPFLDSLANVGLYWKNCLSVTPRTYGVLPSIIGSVPHGIKGFQFGIMPSHHSLFSILQNNNYSTNFFYGGDLIFDNMLDFVSAQEPEHIDNFLPQIESYKKDKRANWWGLFDHVLFEESINYLKSLDNEKPSVNVYLTITTHDPLNMENPQLKEFYDTKAEKIFSKLEKKQEEYYLTIKKNISGFIYIDDCIRDFVNNYSKQIDAENTIFMITGDHSIGIYKNNLSNYSVPLIVWSPLLIRHQKFPNIVSHLSITPSIISFLQHNYDVKVPEKLSWCSLGLDTSSVFKPSEKILFLSYDRIVNTMVYNQYFFVDKTKWNNRGLYEINENLDLQKTDDPLLLENIYSKFLTLKYINNYVYHNDKLIKSNEHTKKEYELIKTYYNSNTIICKTSDTIPSIAGIDTFDIMPEQKIENRFNKIRIKLTADIIFYDYVYQDQQMMLNFVCSGTELNYISSDNITKYLAVDDYICDKKYNLLIEKEIGTQNEESLSININVSTNEFDNNWLANKRFIISNIKVQISGK
ncbi:MAG: LTA synthase family protein [Bacteroidales bacterium]|jgi:phosphoglycerol transferase MdoB-like AlkP superfamily enzyme|nr:LTA synthase family protein [Bacteroidales bacterium]